MIGLKAAQLLGARITSVPKLLFNLSLGGAIPSRWSGADICISPQHTQILSSHTRLNPCGSGATLGTWSERYSLCALARNSLLTLPAQSVSLYCVPPSPLVTRPSRDIDHSQLPEMSDKSNNTMGGQTPSNLHQKVNLDLREAKAKFGAHAIVGSLTGVAMGLAAGTLINSQRAGFMTGTHQPAVSSTRAPTEGGTLGDMCPDPAHPQYVFGDAPQMSSVRISS